MSVLDQLSETTKHVCDALSIGGVFAVFLGWVPEVTALAMLIWVALRIVESWQQVKLNDRKLRGRGE